MKGIILAGGSGSRLYPATRVVSKQLLNIYDKPMIYYPLSVLMLAGIREVLIISTPDEIHKFKNLLGDGKFIGIKLFYEIQHKPNGIAESFLIAEKFIGKSNVSLILGDNIFFGAGIQLLLKNCIKCLDSDKSVILAHNVSNPERYGIVHFDRQGNINSILEKPKQPKSNFAVVGLYFYTNNVVQIAKNITPSKRGELEITSVNNEYLNNNKLKVKIMGRGYAWFDTGTPDSLLDASNFIKTIEHRQGMKIGCIEEIAFKSGFVSHKEVEKSIINHPNEYGDYLKKILD